MESASKEVLTKFISIYESIRQLWDITCSGYGTPRVRAEGYKEFLDLFSPICPNVTIKEIKSKINTIRTNFRRELKKVKLSSNTYTSSLWYFENLRFLEQTLERKAANDRFKMSSSVSSSNAGGLSESSSQLRQPSDQQKPHLRSNRKENSVSYLCGDHIGLGEQDGEDGDAALLVPISADIKTEPSNSPSSTHPEWQPDLSSVGPEGIRIENGAVSHNIFNKYHKRNSWSIWTSQTQQRDQNSLQDETDKDLDDFSDLPMNSLSESSLQGLPIISFASMRDVSTQFEYNEDLDFSRASAIRPRKRCSASRSVGGALQQQHHKGDDEADLLSQVWGQKLKKLRKDQRSLVEKFVAEIFMEAELGTLQKKSVQINN